MTCEQDSQLQARTSTNGGP